jgi:Domain of unknown function (DUF4859)
VKFTNTNLFGNVTFDGSEIPKDVTFEFTVKFPFSATAYSGDRVFLGDGITALATAFVLQPNEIAAAMGNQIKFYGVESNGTLNATTTANGDGHWFAASGNITPWGNTARIFSEFRRDDFSFMIGQYPGQSSPGDQYTVKQALVYEHAAGQTVKATFVFHVTIE